MHHELLIVGIVAVCASGCRDLHSFLRPDNYVCCGTDLDGADMGVRHGRAVGAYDCHVFSDHAQQSRYVADAKLALDQCLAYYRIHYPQKWLTGYVASRSCTAHGGVGSSRSGARRHACVGTQTGPNPGFRPVQLHYKSRHSGNFQFGEGGEGCVIPPVRCEKVPTAACRQDERAE